jgi:2-phosphosulfolactate phosphatase
MKIDVITVPGDCRNGSKLGADVVAVVIDVLRVSTTIVTALAAGADRIFPALTVQEAFDKKESLEKSGTCPGGVLLCGERGGLRVEGFNLGNSPREFTPAVVAGKTLVISSTNGTKAMRMSAGAGITAVGCIVNAARTARFILDEGRNAVFYLSGREEEFSYEDAAGAGLIISRILQERDCSLADSALMCLDLYGLHRHDLPGMMHRTYHGRYLSSIGMGEDLPLCAAADSFDLLPQLGEDGFICRG